MATSEMLYSAARLRCAFAGQWSDWFVIKPECPESRNRARHAEGVRVVTGERARQIDAQVVTLLGPNKRTRISQQENLRAGLHGKGFERGRGCFGLSQEDRVRCRLFLREPDRNTFSSLAGSAFPGMSCIDGFAVHL